MHTPNKRRIVPAKASGFTIIEVLIVLAVAAFIFVIVLLAVPALQRNSRNFERKHGTEVVAAALEQFKVNNGHYPRTETEFDQFIDNIPEITTNGPLRVEFRDSNASHAYWPESDHIAIHYAHWCNQYGNGANATDPIAGDHRSAQLYAVWTQLEPDGSSPATRNTFCVDNYFE